MAEQFTNEEIELIAKENADLKILLKQKSTELEEQTSAVKQLELENGNAKMLGVRSDMLEKQVARTASIVDHAVEILFSERFGQKELESDPIFKAFKLIRQAVDKQELGKPNSMAHDYKPSHLS